MSDAHRHIVSDIVEKLFTKEFRNMERIKTELIEANHALGNPKEGFLYKGRFHTNVPASQQKDLIKKMLHMDLYDRGNFYTETLDRLTKDEQKVRQGLSLMISPCVTAQDVRDSLPEIVLDLLPADIQALSRTRPESWRFSHQPMQLLQQENVNGLISFYVANRMLY
jgi:hypothetical protein